MNLKNTLFIQNISKSVLIGFAALCLVFSMPSYADKDKNTKYCKITRVDWRGDPLNPKYGVAAYGTEMTAKECCESCRKFNDGVQQAYAKNGKESAYVGYMYCGGKDCNAKNNAKFCTDQPWYKGLVNEFATPCDQAKY